MSNMQLNDGSHGAWAGACRTSSGTGTNSPRYIYVTGILMSWQFHGHDMPGLRPCLFFF